MSTPTVDHTPEGPLHERGIEVPGAPEQRPAAGVVQPEAAPGPDQDGQAGHLEEQAEGTAVDGREGRVAGPGAAERPPEHRGVVPGAVEDEVEEHADGEEQPPP